MLVQSPNEKGAISEAAIAYEAVRAGIGVFKPLSEHSRADLIFDFGSQLLRVQCKSARRCGDVLIIRLVTSRHTPGGYVRGRYLPDEVDLIAAHCHELGRTYLIPFRLLEGMSGFQLRLAPPKNGQRAALNWAADHEFPGAVAQLAERLSGTQKATGSNPVSSIAWLLERVARPRS